VLDETLHAAYALVDYRIYLALVRMAKVTRCLVPGFFATAHIQRMTLSDSVTAFRIRRV